MAGGAPESSAVRRAEDGLDESSAEVVVLQGAMERVVLRVASVGAVRQAVTGRAVRREAIAATVWPEVTGDFVTISNAVASSERERGASHAAATTPTH
jgi:hypothetical protein